MILWFNLAQLALGVLNLLGALLVSAATVLVFYHSTRLLLGFLPNNAPPQTPAVAAAVALVLVFTTGFLRGRNRSSLDDHGYASADRDLAPPTGGSAFFHAGASKLVAPAVLLNNVFLSAPMQLRGWIGRFRSLVEPSEQLEQRLHLLLKEIEAKGGWHPARAYAGREREPALLIRMQRIGLSPRKSLVAPK